MLSRPLVPPGRKCGLLFLPLSTCRGIGLGQGTGEFGFHGRELRLVREVGPFVRIIVVIVEFLAAVGIADVAPTLAAESVVALAVRRECRLVPRDDSDLEQRNEAGAVKLLDRRQ